MQVHRFNVWRVRGFIQRHAEVDPFDFSVFTGCLLNLLHYPYRIEVLCEPFPILILRFVDEWGWVLAVRAEQFFEQLNHFAVLEFGGHRDYFCFRWQVDKRESAWDSGTCTPVVPFEW